MLAPRAREPLNRARMGGRPVHHEPRYGHERVPVALLAIGPGQNRRDQTSARSDELVAASAAQLGVRRDHPQAGPEGCTTVSRRHQEGTHRMALPGRVMVTAPSSRRTASGSFRLRTAPNAYGVPGGRIIAAVISSSVSAVPHGEHSTFVGRGVMWK